MRVIQPGLVAQTDSAPSVNHVIEKGPPKMESRSVSVRSVAALISCNANENSLFRDQYSLLVFLPGIGAEAEGASNPGIAGNRLARTRP